MNNTRAILNERFDMNLEPCPMCSTLFDGCECDRCGFEITAKVKERDALLAAQEDAADLYQRNA